MKKSLLMILAAAAVFAACQKEVDAPEKELEETPAEAVITTPSVFPDTITASTESDETKAGMERYDDGGTWKYRHHWNAGDVIYVYKGTSRAIYNCTNPSTGVFTLDSEVSGLTKSFTQYCAVFSNVDSHKQFDLESDNTIKLYSAYEPTISSLEYTSSGDTPGYGNVMVACSNDGLRYTFTSLLGWLKLQLKGVRSVSSIVVNADYKNPLGKFIRVVFPTSGQSISAPEYDESAFDEDAMCSLEVTMSTPVQLNESTPTDFYIALPPMTRPLSSGIRINFAEGGYVDLATNNAVTINANAVTPMAVKDVGFRSMLCTGVNFNVTLKSLAAGTTVSSGDADSLIKGIVFSLGEASPAATSVDLADSGKPIYATFDAGSGLITLHTAADLVSLNSVCSNMFLNMTALESAGMLSQVARSDVSDVFGMFKGCASLESIDLSKLDVSEAISFSNMFNGCSALTGLDLSTLNTSSATTFTYMFGGCAALTSLDLSGFDTKKVTDFSYMFNDCTSLASIDFGTSFFKNNLIRTLDGMFANCSSLGSVNLTKNASASFETNTPYSTMDIICFGCTSLTSFTLPLPGRVKSFIQAFMNCTKLEVIDMDALQDYNNPNYNQMFRECRKLNTLKVSHWNCPTLSSGTTTDFNRNMFLGTCAESTGLDIYISSPQFTWLGYYFNATMNASGFVTRHNPNL